jgi:hypothetical protein
VPQNLQRSFAILHLVDHETRGECLAQGNRRSLSAIDKQHLSGGQLVEHRGDTTIENAMIDRS